MPCGSGKKYKNCCLNKAHRTTEPSGLRAVKISDIGTSHPVMARLCLGMFEMIDFADVPKTKGDDLKARMLEEIVPQLVNAERGARPILDEIGSVMKALQAGVPQDEDGVPCIPGKCDRLDESRGILLQLGSVLDQAFLVINSLWGSSFSRSDFSKIREFVGGKFGSEHIVSKLIADDYSWLIDLRELIRLAENDTGAWGVRDFQVSEGGPDGKFLVTLPTFSNGQQIANSIEVYQHNLFTFIEEITVFSWPNLWIRGS